MKRIEGYRTVWPSLERSTEGWLGGSTSVVVPITGQAIMNVVCGGIEAEMGLL
jgi:hypothetical protein